jgi:hypothetical protein
LVATGSRLRLAEAIQSNEAAGLSPGALSLSPKNWPALWASSSRPWRLGSRQSAFTL